MRESEKGQGVRNIQKNPNKTKTKTKTEQSFKEATLIKSKMWPKGPE